MRTRSFPEAMGVEQASVFFKLRIAPKDVRMFDGHRNRNCLTTKQG